MPQIQLTTHERIEALRRFDYSEPEARFLCWVALHCGYFLPRQAAQFLSGGDGAVMDLIDKIFANCHATAAAYDRTAHVYHLSARSLYAALGQEDNRNRRERECSTIKQKLMALDFVLAHQENTFLGTEQEKVQYFSGTLEVPESKLPARVYRSANAEPTARYFVEKYPIFLMPDQGLGAPISFCFVDEGLVTTAHFETFLKHYDPLFSALPAIQIAYVCDRATPFRGAESVFQKYAAQSAGSGASDAAGMRRTQYFELRRQFESKNFDSLDRAKLIQLRNDELEFAGPENDDMYAAWIAGGDVAVRQLLVAKSERRTDRKLSFSTHLLEHNYDFFGTLTSR